MPLVTVTPLYAAAIAILMVVLSVRTGLARGKHGIALGDGGVPALTVAIRRFGNLSEYAAIAVLVLLLMELKGISAPWLHAYGLTLLALRLLHPFGLHDGTMPAPWQGRARVVSAAGTVAMLTLGAVALILL